MTRRRERDGFGVSTIRSDPEERGTDLPISNNAHSTVSGRARASFASIPIGLDCGLKSGTSGWQQPDVSLHGMDQGSVTPGRLC